MNLDDYEQLFENDQDTATNDKKKEPKEPKKETFLLYKLLKQFTLIGVWISLGSFLEIIGPTLTDLKNSINVNYEEISRCLLVKSLGFFIGSISGGFLHERFYKQTDLIMSIGIYIGAIGITLCAVSNNLSIMAVMLGLTGISEGFINTGGNTMVLHLWGKQATSPMCSLHLGFGIGALSVPQLVAPFLLPESKLHIFSNTTENITSYIEAQLEISTSSVQELNNSTTSSGATPFKMSNLFIPYAIVGAFTAFFATLMLIFFIVEPPKNFPRRKGVKNFVKLINLARCGYGNSYYALMLLALLFVYNIQTVGGERAYGKYIASYSLLNDVHFTKQQSANLSSIFWLCHMCGRLLGIVVSYWVPLNVIMILFISFSTAGSITLSIFGHNTAIILWIFSGLMGVSISLAFPLGMSWANLNMEVNSIAIMILLMGAACGAFIYQYLPGYLFEYVGHRTLMYVMVAYALLLGINFIIMEFVARKIGKPIAKEYMQKKMEKNEAEMEVMVTNRP